MPLPRYYLLLLLFLILSLPITAQDHDLPAPEFLLRQDNQLILIDGYTGETTDIPLELDDDDRVQWSPDGKYLTIKTFVEGVFYPCINLYDVDSNMLMFAETIACGVKSYLFSEDATQLLYISTDTQNDTLWRLDLVAETHEKLYETTTGDEYYNDGLSNLNWSPSQKYLAFEEFESIMGGALAWMIVMNSDTSEYVTVSAPALYYASYYPIWSPDDDWFLIALQEEYVTSGALPQTNHRGDVYLVNPDSGDQQRLTYTPATRETGIHWTADGQIRFTEIVMNRIELSVDDALEIAVVPFEEITFPEEVERESSKRWIDYSPDGKISAWYGTRIDEDGSRTYSIKIGIQYPESIVFVETSDENLQSDNIAIGWRPTDIVYPQG